MKKPLYIFLHIPRTSGTSLVRHIENKYKPEQRLRLYFKELDLEDQKKRFSNSDYHRIVKNYLSKFSKDQLDKVKIIYGHRVPWGVEKYFGRDAIYITFFRDPLKRAVSRFNLWSTSYHHDSYENKKHRKIYKEGFLVNQHVPEFSEWFDFHYKKRYFMNFSLDLKNFFIRLGYYDGKDPKSILEKFYFVGIDKNLNDDFLFLCKFFGFNKYFLNKNISKKYFTLENHPDEEKKLKEVYKWDVGLYKSALKYNFDLRKTIINYYDFVQRARIERSFLLPLTQSFYYPLETVRYLKHKLLNNLDKNNYLYVCEHIPKTAGLTFRYHADKNLNRKKGILLSFENLRLKLYDPPNGPELFRKRADDFFDKFDYKAKSKIKLIYGHPVPYGIHKYFDRPVRYITFFRDPIKRTPSVYNHLVRLRNRDALEERQFKYLQKVLLINNKIPSFDRWLKLKYRKGILKDYWTQIGYLAMLGYAGSMNKMEIKKALNKFYFVGLTNNFQKDSLFIFQKLGFHKYFFDQNISPKHFNPNKIDKKLKSLISENNKEDMFLYREAVKVRGTFLINNKNYFRITKIKSLERKLLFPFTQLLFAPRKTLLRLYWLFKSKKPVFVKIS